ncbi:YciI family protein [Paraclostridium sordellii]|uniref:YciI-like protein n=1 Tax=Paraclostridium sordellii TaxID=1505 RepID=A0A0C7QSE1_PARSO|nr:YciI family protein [Paeniclostridium sordellii]CEN77594.1 YciI-like protein [[Clostridium] sordellii] [Paeniclostridium sordellii]CEO06161.1 YciI-like protein [[Clostridium] sordellii] [Paeniclostridium sordellii]CEP86405.1 YciI-like protein [[Clostridium] sordellii] [Paeniclostridium sordellii]CEP99878.1 YciI-like protein [[Clostridium] sordellii] [Paeniclostridium sordellii]CEQ02681.1 YciI-like protein [[Clostridium] sordellii] [Paeniclostridium sordellii]
MRYFIVEGILKSKDEIDKDTMTKHMNYSQKAMDDGLILMSGLKKNMSGGIFIMKSDSIENIKEYLDNEPFKLEGIQDYKIIEFSPHYFNESPSEWFN